MYFVESEYLENLDFMQTFFHRDQAVKYIKKCYKMEKGRHSWHWSNNYFSIASVRNESGDCVASIDNRGTVKIYN